MRFLWNSGPYVNQVRMWQGKVAGVFPPPHILFLQLFFSPRLRIFMLIALVWAVSISIKILFVRNVLGKEKEVPPKVLQMIWRQ